MTISYTPPPTSKPLPVMATVQEIYDTFWQHKDALPRLALWPFVMLVPLAILDLLSGDFALWSLISTVLSYGIYTLFSVAWHRLVLLESTNESTTPAAWQSRHTVFFGYLIGIALLCLVVVLPILFSGVLVPSGSDETAGDGGGPLGPFILAALVALFVLFYMVVRLSFVFPARAVDEVYRLRDSWRQTKGNGLRLIAIWLLTVGAMALGLMIVAGLVVNVIGGLFFGLSGPEQGVGAVLFLAGFLQIVVYFIVLALSVTTLSISFRICTGWIPAPPGQAPPAPAIPQQEEDPPD